MKTVRVIVAGSRTLKSISGIKDYIGSTLNHLFITYVPKELEFINGTSFIDSLGKDFALSIDAKYKDMPADWDKYGKRAGIYRNEDMAKYAVEAESSILVAFYDGKSHGTANMIQLANNYEFDEIHVYRIRREYDKSR